MNKKINHRQKSIYTSDEDDEVESNGKNSVKLLHNIHQKLDASPALNGGFDRLLYKIDGIEKSQVQIVEKVDKIHDAIYHPDEGLFARIAATKASQTESMIRVEKQVEEITSWKDEAQSQDENCEKEADEIQLKIQRLENTIVNVERFQSLVISSLKWLAAGLGGALVSVIAKILYNSIKLLP
jgi:hypothetical protein